MRPMCTGLRSTSNTVTWLHGRPSRVLSPWLLSQLAPARVPKAMLVAADKLVGESA